MLEAIEDIKSLLSGKTAASLEGKRDIVTRAALERFLEILSEASRHLPDDWKHEFGPTLDWKGVANIGNVLRHEYDRLSNAKLWEIYENDLDPLQLALERMIAVHRDIAP